MAERNCLAQARMAWDVQISGTTVTGRLPADALYPFGHPTPYAYNFKEGSKVHDLEMEKVNGRKKLFGAGPNGRRCTNWW
jgi:hypothetical protein